MIIFVGDKPSKQNLSLDTPFVGTQSYKRLLEWIWEMDVDINLVKLCNRQDPGYKKYVALYKYFGEKVKVVALGKNAAKDLSADLGEGNFHELPHPSGLNRVINDKSLMKQKLKECREWLHAD
jgi:hypothetical protein